MVARVDKYVTVNQRFFETLPAWDKVSVLDSDMKVRIAWVHLTGLPGDMDRKFFYNVCCDFRDEYGRKTSVMLSKVLEDSDIEITEEIPYSW